MTCLLDTHVWLWLLAEPQRLRPSLLAELQDGGTTLFLSAVSSCEISIKRALGELGALVKLLDASVELRTDGGGRVPAARRVVRGRGSVSRALLGLRLRYANVEVVPTLVNAGPGFALWQGGRLLGVGALAISEAGRVLAIDVVLNPQKLDHLRSMWTAQR